MADGKTLNAANLERLGAPRLAALLIEIADTTAAKRRLRTELAGSFGPEEAARDIRRRLAAIRQGQGRLSRKRMAGVVAELVDHWAAVTGLIAPDAPALALDLGWDMLALAAPLDRRADDGADELVDLFGVVMPILPTLLDRVPGVADHLPDQVAGLIGQEVGPLTEPLLAATAAALGPQGLRKVQALVAGDRANVGPGTDWVVRRRHLYYDDALRRIADDLGDPNSYAATLSDADYQRPDLVQGLAVRLADAGRGAEAIALINALEASKPRYLSPVFPLLKARILADHGDLPAAQAIRWRVFARDLSPDALHDFLKPLPDFDDMEAEEKAFDLLASHPEVHRGLRFLIDWPALPQAAAMVLRRFRELDGDLYVDLGAAADALADRYPLAATLALRAMIDHTLTWSRHSRYRHAARHLVTCAGLNVVDWDGVPDHTTYVAGLRRAHSRKPGFWAEVEAAG